MANPVVVAIAAGITNVKGDGGGYRLRDAER